MNLRKLTMHGATVAALVLSAHQSFASGFEKTVMWGAQGAGMGGISAPWIQGADALYFNPAGLATDKAGHSVSFNVSPTWSTFSGPINFNNDTVTSTQSLTTAGALNYQHSLSDSLGLGIGYYAGGGAKAVFDDVDMLSGRKANVKTDLAVTELALGAGYKMNNEWKFGAALRYVMAKADFTFINPATATGSAYADLALQGLSANTLAFKLGTQWKPSEKTMYSLVWRSEAVFHAAGTYGGFFQSGATQIPITANGATAHTVLPMAFNLGARHDYDQWHALAEYVYTQYSRVTEIFVEGATNAGPVPINGARALLNWKDQHQLKLGGEYVGWDWPLRFGYILTSPVTDKTYARANLTPPGFVHTLTLGSGHDFLMGSNMLTFNAAVEYNTGSGDAEGGLPPGQALDANAGYTRAGTFSVSAYSLDIGLGYNF